MPDAVVDLGFVAFCQEALGRLRQRCSGVLWCSITSRDGLELASLGAGNEKLSVMAGTLQALADGIASEAQLGTCREMYVSGPEGFFVTAGVRNGTRGVVVAVLASTDATLGMVLSALRAAGEELAPRLAPQD